MQQDTPVHISLYEVLKDQLGHLIEPVRLTKATLVHLSHALEDVVLTERLPAMIFTGFQESSHWRRQTERYRELADVAQQVCIFAGKPLPDDSPANQLHIELSGDDPLRQEWFLLIVSDRFSVLLCGQDQMVSEDDEATRQFDTFWTMQPNHINQVLDRMETVIAHYRPERLETLRVARRDFTIQTPDSGLISRLTGEMLHYSDTLQLRLWQAATYERQINIALREQQQLNDLFFELSTHFSIALDDQGRIVAVNTSLCDQLGYVDHELIGVNFVRIFLPSADQSRLAAVLPQLSSRDVALSWRGSLVGRDGNHYVVDWQAISGMQGERRLLFAFGVNMTDFLNTYERLQESERRFRIMTENLPDIVTIIDIVQNQTVYVNVDTILGYDATYFDAPLSHNELLLEEDIEQFEDFVAAIEDGKIGSHHRVDGRFRGADGQIYWLELRATVMTVDSLGIVRRALFVITDVTERKQAEWSLKLSEERFRQVTDSINQYIYAWEYRVDGTEDTLFSSPVFERLTGYPVSTVMADPGFWRRQIIHADDSSVADRQYRQVISGQSATSEYRIRRADGSVIWVRDTATITQDELTGNLTIYGTVEDVSAERAAKEMLLEQERLRVALEKERELVNIRSQFMTTISHEFRTPLSTILISTEMMQRYGERMAQETRQQRLESIASQVTHMREMLDDIALILRSESGGLSFQPKPTNLHALIQSVISDVRTGTQSQHMLDYSYRGDKDNVMVDPRMVRHILINLLTNAYKYSPAQSAVQIQVDVGSQVIMLKVSDQGIGVPVDDIPRLFEPFKRAGNVGQIGGSGLGLKIVRDCAELHGGYVTVESAENQGTTFTVVLRLGYTPSRDDQEHSV